MFVMSGRRISLLIAATALLSAATGVAHAADKADKAEKAKPPQVDLTVRSDTTSSIPNAGMRSLKWDARKGRWGVTLNMEQSEVRPQSLNDVQAGAYYHITPSLRVGGAVALRDEQVTPGPKKIGAEESQPRVRLESSFKF
ncbi:hypothetical protein LJR219_000287 [Phenylobacterium sp. LjRoot219]|uniref:NtrZ family periplasmic regulatory protein n=1 Tax=Phenylobacterium sp. LjRoot219 TaxID=3342283 RepID=UPI003ECD4213